MHVNKIIIHVMYDKIIDSDSDTCFYVNLPICLNIAVYNLQPHKNSKLFFLHRSSRVNFIPANNLDTRHCAFFDYSALY